VRRVAYVFVGLMMAACSRGTSGDVKQQAPTTPAAQPAPAATASVPPVVPASVETGAKPVPAVLPDVVARVNGEPINKADLESAVKGLEAQAGAAVPADQRDRIFRGVLNDLISYRLLLQEAKARKVAVPDADVDAQIAQVRSQFQNDAQFQQALAAQKVTLETMRQNARSAIAVEKLLQTALGEKSAATPEAVADFYMKNLEKFKQAERVRASHILITVPQNADATTKQMARAKAEALLKDLKSGKDFATAARESSQDPGSAANGGDLGFFPQGQMVPAFDQAAFALKPGEMSELIETPFGFHIIKVAEKQPAKTVPLAEAKGQIEQYLLGQNRRTQTEAFVNELKAKAKIELLI
jgi:peptidyl-prolyl cis-trans isomerase C